MLMVLAHDVQEARFLLVVLVLTTHLARTLTLVAKTVFDLLAEAGTQLLKLVANFNPTFPRLLVLIVTHATPPSASARNAARARSQASSASVDL
jgi:hypothetical protein